MPKKSTSFVTVAFLLSHCAMAFGLHKQAFSRKLFDQSGSVRIPMTVKRITVDELQRLLERGENVFFADTRNPKAWAEAETKLPQAIRVPADAVEGHFADIPRDRLVVAYCT